VRGWQLGDRVICPSCDQIPGKVIEVGYNGYTKVKYDDGVIGTCLGSDLVAAPATESASAVEAANQKDGEAASTSLEAKPNEP
jgi:hypothetical protein